MKVSSPGPPTSVSPLVCAASWLFMAGSPVRVPGVAIESQLFGAALVGKLGGAEGIGDALDVMLDTEPEPETPIKLDAVRLETCCPWSIRSWPFPRLSATFDPDCVIAACTAAKLLNP